MEVFHFPVSRKVEKRGRKQSVSQIDPSKRRRVSQKSTSDKRWWPQVGKRQERGKSYLSL
jgi:hypothetical protein